MAEKQRYNVSLPEHVATAVDKNAKAIGATPTEYAGDIIRWWFGQGCPPIRPDEAELRKLAGGLAARIKRPPADFDIWKLETDAVYTLVDEPVEKALTQLGVPNLFSQHKEHDQVRILVAFDNHPTHWLMFNLFKGGKTAAENGLSLIAHPKSTVSRDDMLLTLTIEGKKMQATGPVAFSQIPNITSLQTAQK